MNLRNLRSQAMRDALRGFVPFVQIKKREKLPWRILAFSKVAGFSMGVFSFLEL